MGKDRCSSMSDWKDHVPNSLLLKYEIHNINHAVEILSQAYTTEYAEIINALERFTLSVADIIKGGGNESAVPKRLSGYLQPLGWHEVRITADLLVKLHRRNPNQVTEFTIKVFIDGHNIDFVKNRVALDMEWNSKDQTFDRDLYAMRRFFECGIIACGVIVTRSERLNPIFSRLGIMKKYGASTTWMGKLLPRISSGRHGGCPLMIVGITPNAILDLEVQ